MERTCTALAVALVALVIVHCKRAPRAVEKRAQTGAAAVPQQTAKQRPPPLRHRRFESAGAAVAEILKAKPLVVGFGEYHQKTDSARVRSAVKRFTTQVLDRLSKQASDLVVETWITEGRCGKQEKKVVREVEATTKRPAQTEDEVVTLLKRAKASGIQPHILKLSCKEYDTLSGSGKVDYEKLLTLIKLHLQRKATRLLTRQGQGAHRMIAIYGGALHNDLYPHEDLRAFTYAAELKKLTGGRYVEVDLYVPEYVEGDENLKGERWYPLLKHASTHGVLLVKRGEGSYILVLRRGVKP